MNAILSVISFEPPQDFPNRGETEILKQSMEPFFRALEPSVQNEPQAPGKLDRDTERFEFARMEIEQGGVTALIEPLDSPPDHAVRKHPQTPSPSKKQIDQRGRRNKRRKLP